MLRFICHALLSFPFVGGRGHYSFQNQFLFSDSFSIGCDYSHFSVVVVWVRLLAFLYLFSFFLSTLFPSLFLFRISSLSQSFCLFLLIFPLHFLSLLCLSPFLIYCVRECLCKCACMCGKVHVCFHDHYACISCKCDHISTVHVCKQSLAFFKHKTIQTFVYLNPVYYSYPEQEVERLRSVTLQPFICSKSLSVRNLSQKWSERLIWVPFYRSGFVYKGRRDWQ